VNQLLRALLFTLIVISVAACCPNGCFVLTGPAFEALAHPTPMREQWSRSDRSDAERRLDWEKCGGYKNGNFSPTQKAVDDERRPGETNDSAADGRLFRELQRCMLRNGYHYIGKCYDNEISRSLPACGAP
jgi:hypothetical protein